MKLADSAADESSSPEPARTGPSAASEDSAPPPQASAVVIAGEEAVDEEEKKKKEKKKEWNEKVFKKLTGRKVDKLWRIYCQECAEEGGKTSTEVRPTHVESKDASATPSPLMAESMQPHTDSEDDFEIL